MGSKRTAGLKGPVIHMNKESCQALAKALKGELKQLLKANAAGILSPKEMECGLMEAERTANALSFHIHKDT